MTATNKPKDAKVREFWIFDDGGPEFDRRVLDRPISANDVHVIEHSAYTAALDKIASLEKIIEVSEKALQKVSENKALTIYNHSEEFMSGANAAFGQSAEVADEALEQIKQMKAGLDEINAKI